MTLREIEEKYIGLPYNEHTFYRLRADLAQYFQSYDGFFRFEKPTGIINGRMYFYSRDLFEKLSRVLYAWFIAREVPSGTYNVFFHEDELTEFIIKWEYRYGLESALTIENRITDSVLNITYSALNS